MERVEDALPCREDACTATFATSCLEAPGAAAPLSAVWGGAQSVPFAKGSSRRPLTVGVSCDSARPTVKGIFGLGPLFLALCNQELVPTESSLQVDCLNGFLFSHTSLEVEFGDEE